MNELKIDIKSFKFKKESKLFFENITMSLQENEHNFLIGMSGTGKTTLLNAILGMKESYLVHDISFKTNEKVYTRNQVQSMGLIGLISQTPSLIPWESVYENLIVPHKLNKNLKIPTDKMIISELKNVGLKSDIQTCYPHELSFGMQSRVALVRTLLYKPTFLFLDELFTGIDTINSELIAERLTRYIKQHNAVSLSITHDIDRAINIASNIFVINSKQKIKKIEKPFNKTEIVNLINNH